MDPFNRDFNQYANELLKRWNSPSVAIAVVDGDEIFTQVCCHKMAASVNSVT